MVTSAPNWRARRRFSGWSWHRKSVHPSTPPQSPRQPPAAKLAYIKRSTVGSSTTRDTSTRTGSVAEGEAMQKHNLVCEGKVATGVKKGARRDDKANVGRGGVSSGLASRSRRHHRVLTAVRCASLLRRLVGVIKEVSVSLSRGPLTFIILPSRSGEKRAPLGENTWGKQCTPGEEPGRTITKTEKLRKNQTFQRVSGTRRCIFTSGRT